MKNSKFQKNSLSRSRSKDIPCCENATVGQITFFCHGYFPKTGTIKIILLLYISSEKRYGFVLPNKRAVNTSFLS
jgi:hypothetical protein